jgi:hypothetical protein
MGKKGGGKMKGAKVVSETTGENKGGLQSAQSLKE